MTIIDVRSPQEYQSGHAESSINIPLQEITNRVLEIKAFNQPIILCCASGNISGQAIDFLTSEGVECENGGAWQNLVNEL